MKERFQTFTVLIAKIGRSIKKIKNREMAEYGLRSVHVTCLYYLYSAESLTATELCELCEEDKATISRGLEFLETEGYIVCDAKQQKRYKSPLMLTERGRELGRKIADKINFVLDEICVDLSEDERAEFYRCLTLISDNLELCAGGLKAAKRNKTTDNP